MQIRALTYDLHQFIHNFKCIAGLVLRLLKPLRNCRLIRKMWVRFLERLIMLNNGLHKRRRWVRHIGPPCKLIDYLKTVEFYAMKTSQFKTDKNADSKKYTLNVQYLHWSRMFYIPKFNMHYFSPCMGRPKRIDHKSVKSCNKGSYKFGHRLSICVILPNNWYKTIRLCFNSPRRANAEKTRPNVNELILFLLPDA